MTDLPFIQVLDIAIDALEICNSIHERTGALKVPLDDVVEEMGNGITKKKIQDGFWILVDLGIIRDDSDDQNMNYDADGNNELIDLLQQIKIKELEKENESEISASHYIKLPHKN